MSQALGLTLALSWGAFVVYWLGGGRVNTPGFALFAVLYMWLPGLIPLFLARREGLSLPLTFRPNRYWLWAWLLPVGLTFAAILASLPLAPWRGLPLPPEAQGLPPWALWTATLAGALLAGGTVNALVALGEELMWRGYLWEKLKPKGFWPASLEIGFWWGLWHAPLILAGYNYPQHPVLGVGMMTLFTLLLTPSLLWLREKGGNLWAPAIFHGTLNAIGPLSWLAVERTHDLLVGLLGLAGFFPLVLFNLWLRRQIH